MSSSFADLGYSPARVDDDAEVLDQLRAAGPARVGLLQMMSREEQVRLLRRMAETAKSGAELAGLEGALEELFPRAQADAMFIRIEFRGVFGAARTRLGG